MGIILVLLFAPFQCLKGICSVGPHKRVSGGGKSYYSLLQSIESSVTASAERLLVLFLTSMFRKSINKLKSVSI